MAIVLASSSKYRQALLNRLSISFLTHSPDIDESPLINEPAQELVLRLAKEKAEAVQASLDLTERGSSIIIASDQVGCSPSGEILTKAGSKAKAVEQLLSLSQQTVTFYTSLYVGRPEQYSVDLVPYEVTFRSLQRDEIQRYVELENPIDCAGSFKSEGLGVSLFAKQSGSDPTSLIGLPLITLCQRLREHGIAIP